MKHKDLMTAAWITLGAMGVILVVLGIVLGVHLWN